MTSTTTNDEDLLAQLGYKQELHRELTSFTNIGASMSAICICSGLTSLFGFGLLTGGPVVMTWGWMVVSFFSMMVGLAMAEICSAFPTSGGLYYWAARLSRPEHKAFASWMTGWFNLLGQMAVTAGVVFGLSLMIAATASIASDLTYTPTPGIIVAIHISIAFSIGLANSMGPKVMYYIMTVSTVWQVITPFLIVLAVLVKAPVKQSATFVFTEFKNETGIESVPWVVLVGLLTSQFTMTGYDASAHMTEETKNASISGPVGIVMAIGVSAATGFLFIVGLLFGMQDYDSAIGTATGLPLAQILLDAAGKELTLFLMVVNIVCCWFASYSCLLANSRVIYAFSRDGAMPFSDLWHLIHPKLQNPFNATWLACFLYSILALPYLGNSTAFTAITSIATIGLYISYGIPIVCKLMNPDLFHKPGPFSLGRWSNTVGYIAVAWILLITCLFVLPTAMPVTAVNMNYACVLVGAVLFGAGGTYVVSAHKWFKGPVTNVEFPGHDVTAAFEERMKQLRAWVQTLATERMHVPALAVVGCVVVPWLWRSLPASAVVTFLFDPAYFLLILWLLHLYQSAGPTRVSPYRQRDRRKLRNVRLKRSRLVLSKSVQRSSTSDEVDLSKPLVRNSVRSNTPHISDENVFLLVECIVCLVLMDGGGVDIPKEQMAMIRATAYTLPSSYPKMSQLVTFLQIIQQNQTNNNYIDFSWYNHVPDIFSVPAPVADGISFALAAVNVRGARDCILDHVAHLWVRQHLCSILALVLGGCVREAGVEALELLGQTRTLGKHDSIQTLVSLHEEEHALFDVRNGATTANSYLFYAHSERVLQEGWELHGTSIKIATLRMPGMGLRCGDFVAILADWCDGGLSTPKSNFVCVEKDQELDKWRQRVGNGFGKIILTRLERVDELQANESRLTLAVLREIEDVKVDYCGVSGVMESRVVFENRIKDLLEYGALRVERQIVETLFGELPFAQSL
ncbi:hypothetical protein HDU81_002613 [Chytriomyces hyalinus]|nr:hypothetical protein HDU81_002613 [Chytriomyces hyalinus]